MKKRSFFIGPGAASLLLVVVVVGMSVLGLLALMSARSDARLMERSRNFAVAEFEAMAKSEESLAALDALLAECAAHAQTNDAYLSMVAAALPEGMELEGSMVAWTEENSEGRMLRCAVEIAPLGSFPRCAWQEHLFMAAQDEAFFD